MSLTVTGIEYRVKRPELSSTENPCRRVENERRTQRHRHHNPIVSLQNRSDLTLRPLTEADLGQLSRWLAEPHVAQWWRDPADLESIAPGER